MGVPLRIGISIAPCAELEAQPELCAMVLLLLQHMGLPRPDEEGWVPEPPLSSTEPRNWRARVSDAEDFSHAAADRAVLPPRLLGSARLCCVRRKEELDDGSVALADRRPISEENERAALALLREACDALRWDNAELRSMLDEAPNDGGRGTSIDDASDRHSGGDHEGAGEHLAKRQCTRAPLRSQLMRRFVIRRQRVLNMAIAELDARRDRIDAAGLGVAHEVVWGR